MRTSRFSLSTLSARGARLSRLNLAFSAIALASLAACGGGGTTDPVVDAPVAGTPATPTPVTPTPVTPTPVTPTPVTPTPVTPPPVAPTPPAPPPPPPPPVTITGKVMVDMAIKGAVVCLDLNANGLCDTAEPKSDATGADGAYSLSFDGAVVTPAAVAKGVLIANIAPGVAVADAAAPTVGVTTKAYVLSAPVSKPAQINPLTTLVQTGVASGLSLAESTAAVAVQMGVTEADIFDYQSSPATTAPTSYSDTPRLMAKVTAAALEDGATLSVIGIAAKRDPIAQQVTFNFTDVNNFYTRDFVTTDKGTAGLAQTTDVRKQRVNGLDAGDSVLYQTAYLSKTGWTRCDAAGFSGTRGSPNRSQYCGGGQPSVGYTLATDVSGKSMGDTVRATQAATDSSNTVNITPTLLDGKTFPTGSQLLYRKNVNLGEIIYINNLNATNEVNVRGGVANLEGYIASTMASPVNLTNGSGMNYIGTVDDSSHWLMVSFADNVSKAQYYSCTFNAAATAVTGCVALNAGTFTITTVNGFRHLRFQNLPAVLPLNYTVGYGEYNGGVARYRLNKADSSVARTASQRFNDVAANAMRKAVGL